MQQGGLHCEARIEIDPHKENGLLAVTIFRFGGKAHNLKLTRSIQVLICDEYQLIFLTTVELLLNMSKSYSPDPVK